MADQNKNPGTKQGDGDASESFRANPSDKQGSGSTGGRSGSGSSGQSDGMDKSKSGTGGSGKDSGYAAGSKEKENDTDIERPDDNRGGSGLGRSGSASQ